MSRIDNAIALVKEYRTINDRPWIFDGSGNLRDDIISADVLPILEELKEHEINVNDEFFDNFIGKASNSFNTYNWSAPISNDICCFYTTIYDCCIAIMKIHLFGDIRAHYTNWFAVKFESFEQMAEMESCLQSIEINERYVAYVDIWSETYSVYDYENMCDVGEYREIEKSDLLKEILVKE